jgi:glutamate-1-semialdehyde aminotransferase
MEEPRIRGEKIYARAKQRIPGGTNLLSKRPKMYAPGCWPAFYIEARGCEIWDADRRHFYDFAHNAVDAVFGEIAGALEKNTVTENLSGPPAHQGFQRLL